MPDTGPPSRSREEFLAALVRLRDGLGEWPNQPQYIEYKRRDDPAHTWLYDRSEAFDSWADAIEAARETYNERDTADACRHCRDCGSAFVAHWDDPLCGGCRGQ